MKYLMFFCKQKSNFILPVFKDIGNLLCWVFWASLVTHIQDDTTTLYKTFVFIWRKKKKKKKSWPMFFWRYCKDTQTSYFGFFGYAWLDTHNMTKSDCRKFRCFKNKLHFFTSSLIYYILKNPAVWLVNCISVHNSRTGILPDMRFWFVVKDQ